jgi:PPK2 family polyphosphate:nucleotide phosphotransferase
MNEARYAAPSGKRFRLKDFDPADTGTYAKKEDAVRKLERDVEELASLQDVLYAQDSYSLLVIVQAMDAAGKDGVIKHVMSGINPQGCQVVSFKQPSTEELSHDYLWRCVRALPARGRIGIFNRSYYEEVLAVRVHPEFLKAQRLPGDVKPEKIWKRRFEEINNFERHLTDNGTVVLKFFLNVSRKEQKQRFLERIDTPEKNWKFSSADLKERAHWESYMKAYEEAIRNTSTAWAPWYVVPADHKWFTRVVVAGVIVRTLRSLRLAYPKTTKQQKAELETARRALQRG